MKGNSVQHRRKLEFHFAFRSASVDARITVDVSGMLSFSDQLTFSCRFFFTIFFFSYRHVGGKTRVFFLVVGRELFT